MTPDRSSERTPEPLPLVVDAHAHVSWSREFDDDRDAVLERAWAAGLHAIIDVGVDTATSLACRELARAEARVHAVAGIHPHEAEHLERERGPLREALGEGGFVAIGEIGLDFFRNLSPPGQQYEAFRWQLELAREVELPVVIHSRDADEESFAVIEEWARRVGRYLGPDREIGMMHCYSGDSELAQRYVEIGFLVSVPGTVTFAKNERGQAVAYELPLERMLVETDCPYLTPVPWRGRRNEPAYVTETVRFVSGLRGDDPEVLARTTAANAARLFAIDLGGGSG